jgi:(p)ppGpp synthase/HD superfamily hydrolase
MSTITHTILTHTQSAHSQVQIRSQRMHWEAEYGAAAHTKYKALILPESVESAGSNTGREGGQRRGRGDKV